MSFDLETQMTPESIIAQLRPFAPDLRLTVRRDVSDGGRWGNYVHYGASASGVAPCVLGLNKEANALVAAVNFQRKASDLIAAMVEQLQAEPRICRCVDCQRHRETGALPPPDRIVSGEVTL